MEHTNWSELERKLKQYKETLQSLKSGHVVDDYLLLKDELTQLKESYLACLQQVEELTKTVNQEQERLQKLEENQIRLLKQNNQQSQLLEQVEQVFDRLHQEDENKHLLDKIENIVRDMLERMKSYDDKLEKMEERIDQEEENDIEVDQWTQPIARRSGSDYKQLQKLIESSNELQENQQHIANRPISPSKMNQYDKSKSTPSLPPIGKTIKRPRITRKDDR
ncbi:hypothetical protein [Bacillus sp. JCM 19034]|uniref:hypothetical protein n=1 Tax=Bacillus sp. JCM 19034 TaxID=1481928 RepID=UPI0007833781|nr:hypothetical protein [Bacillus sp. JCM 19034]